MDVKEILKHVDHTLLLQQATWEEIRQICDDAVKYGTASVCIPPSYVKQAREDGGLHRHRIPEWIYDDEDEGIRDKGRDCERRIGD